VGGGVVGVGDEELGVGAGGQGGEHVRHLEELLFDGPQQVEPGLVGHAYSHHLQYLNLQLVVYKESKTRSEISIDKTSDSTQFECIKVRDLLVGTLNDVSLTSEAFSPNIALRSFSSGDN
jgi:hypothetical protein